MKSDKLQQRIIAFVMRCINWGYDEEQMIGFTMMNYSLFYDEAKKRVENALSEINPF